MKIHPPQRVELLALTALGALLIAAGALRQEFMGDGVRHLRGALAAASPEFGSSRWLLFPALMWGILRPAAAAGLIGGLEPALRLILALCVLAGILYLWSLNIWLRAEGCGPRARGAALVLAAATISFLTLYTDVAEVQIPGAVVVYALARCRVRFARGRGGVGTVVATVAAISAASLIYQALVLAVFFLPLVAPVKMLRSGKAMLGAATIVLCVPAFLIAGRLLAGDDVGTAVMTTFRGERGGLVRSSMAQPSPLKWVAAAVAGPPQAIVGLWEFQGLPALVDGLSARDTRAMSNLARFIVGLLLVAGLAWTIARTRDWRLALAAFAVVALPMVRNQQYTYAKFFVLWPVVLALASTKVKPKQAVMIAIGVLALNVTLLARHISLGRERYEQFDRLYRGAAAGDCFFTSGWDAPFSHRWPGSTVAVISVLWMADELAVQGDRLRPALRECFCGTGRVWTDTTADNAPDVARVASHFIYNGVPVENFLFRNGDGDAVAAPPARMFVFSTARQTEMCAMMQR